MTKRTFLILLACIHSALAQSETQKIDFHAVAPALIRERLERVPHKQAERRKTLEAMFREVGCDGDRLVTQRVPRSPEPNVICTLDGEGPDVIVVGAHFDSVPRGKGVVDNWSGAVLLPSLYQSISGKPRRHRFVFIGFAAEEDGLFGSAEYVKKLSAEEKASIQAMVNFDSLGLTSPKVENVFSDKRLLDAYARVATALRVPLAVVNFDKVGDDDSHSFRKAKIPTISIHSITNETWRILHSAEDDLKVIDHEQYYSAYRLAAVYLVYLDSSLAGK